MQGNGIGTVSLGIDSTRNVQNSVLAEDNGVGYPRFGNKHPLIRLAILDLKHPTLID